MVDHNPAAQRETTRIAAWSGPRNLSTAMLRSWENRPDTEVLDEPLYAAALAETGDDHPMRDEILAAGPTRPDDAIERCRSHPASPHGASAISYQKHMAHHLLPSFDRNWLDDFVHVLLIRHPRRVIASYARVWPVVTVEAIGLPQQLELLERAVVVIDSDDFLVSPHHHLVALCDAVGVAFDEAMLSWPAGSRSSDGVWAPAWYAAVEASTAFGPAPADDPNAVELPPGLESVAAAATEIYRELRSARAVVT